MDDFTPDIKRTLDDAVDEGESLSFRYQNVLDQSVTSVTLIL